MMCRPVASDEHLIDAFWTAVRLLAGHRAEGRLKLRVGASARADFGQVANSARSQDPTPDEVVASISPGQSG
jgi:hypothetical protein